MKVSKWKKWRLSKRQYPTYIIYGQNGPGSGGLVIGRTKAAAALAATLGQARVDKMKVTDTPTEWVFMEPCNQV